ncbi:hypothetical protein HPC49_06820 [Pyxidicoccus fallax]|uniref:Uncharacterized protein n=1 Tax=Pyxidicoccus fallax TaxID=394095 RepID=A0A848LI78_9BACT|nr:hypothetical protein [Pyxidicoccus fallax]NMO17417.1 hypothetical protein [Pyxidicoccus fallax]NPC77966.1 hypothetical protein [Pyxidicoccus fallax]
MSAEVLAIGPFHRGLLPFLDQPPERHATTREGAVLVVSVFRAPEGSTRSRELAACVGVEPWDFKSHAFDPRRADLGALRDFHAGYFRCEEHAKARAEHPCDACERACEAPVERFVRLRDAGFEFFFCPNG